MVWQLAIPIALQAAGAAYSNRENAKYDKRVQREAEAASEAEAQRQEGYQAELQQIFQQLLGQSGAGGFDERLNANAAGRIANQDAMPTAQVQAPISRNANPVVGNAISQALSQASAQSQSDAAARAKLSAYGDASFDWSRILGRGADQMNTIGGFARGSGRLLPLEQNAAARNVKPPSGLGEILQGAGALGTVYTARGM